jgi:hypothetical protein
LVLLAPALPAARLGLARRGTMCETVAAERFSLDRPAMSKEVGEKVKEMLRTILDEEEGL